MMAVPVSVRHRGEAATGHPTASPSPTTNQMRWFRCADFLWLITGVYWPHTAMKGAKEARERVHFIGFVNARNFTQDEHGASIEFIANPHLLKNVRAMRAAADTWPLSSRFILNGIN